MHTIFLPAQLGHPNTVRPTAPPIKAVPNDKWPLWAKAIALLKTKTETGVGDTVERVIGKATSRTFKAWYQTTFKRSCGCSERKLEWNLRYPYA